jgi:hypothetical protein
MRSIILAVVALALTVSAQDTSLRVVKKRFNEADIPDDLDISFKPKTLLEVTFPQTGITPPLHVHAGGEYDKNETSAIPYYSVLFPPSPPKSGYRPSPATQIPILNAEIGVGPFVLALLDPDAPKPEDPKNAQYRHFLGANFWMGTPGEVGLQLLNTTPAITEWTKPAPPDGSDSHRYVFLLYHQPIGFNDQKEVTSETSRGKFNISEFAEKTKLGEPIAGTFMFVGPDRDGDCQ